MVRTPDHTDAMIIVVALVFTLGLVSALGRALGPDGATSCPAGQEIFSTVRPWLTVCVDIIPPTTALPTVPGSG